MRRPLALLIVAAALAIPAVAAQASDSGPPLAGTRYAPARAFVKRFCADCHTETGTNPTKRRAYPTSHMDTYEDWKGQQAVLKAVIDKWDLHGKIMPPPPQKVQPTDADRRLILQWLSRRSPNTPDGK